MDGAVTSGVAWLTPSASISGQTRDGAEPPSSLLESGGRMAYVVSLEFV